MNYLELILGDLIRQLPVFIVWMVGIILALKLWPHSPRKARLSFIAFVGLLAITFLSSLVHKYVISLIEQGVVDVWRTGSIFLAISIVTSTIFAVLLIWFFKALFGKQENVEKTPEMLK